MARQSTLPKSGQADSVFTVDNENASPIEMPSVTKLLNRKKLGLTNPTASNSISPPTDSQQPPGSAAPTSGNALMVRKATPRSAERRKPKLAQWDNASLESATDRFQKGVLLLIKSGASEALLLTPPYPIKHHTAEEPFSACCAYMTQDREHEELWRGLSLNPKLVPDVWKLIFSKGYFEVGPSLHGSSGHDSASFLKKAFGLLENDWLILVRCGSATSCTGILALVSKASLHAELSNAFGARQAQVKSRVNNAA